VSCSGTLNPKLHVCLKASLWRRRAAGHWGPHAGRWRSQTKLPCRRSTAWPCGLQITCQVRKEGSSRANSCHMRSHAPYQAALTTSSQLICSVRIRSSLCGRGRWNENGAKAIFGSHCRKLCQPPRECLCPGHADQPDHFRALRAGRLPRCVLGMPAPAPTVYTQIIRSACERLSPVADPSIGPPLPALTCGDAATTESRQAELHDALQVTTSNPQRPHTGLYGHHKPLQQN